MTVEPISTPARYDDKQFLISSFQAELRDIEQALRGRAEFFFDSNPRLGIAMKLLIAGGVVIWFQILLIGKGFSPADALGLPATFRMGAGMATDLWPFTGAILAIFAGIWMWDNLHSVLPMVTPSRFGESSRHNNLLRVIQARRQRLTFEETYSSTQAAGAGVGDWLKLSSSSSTSLHRRPYSRVGLVEEMRSFIKNDFSKVFNKLYVGID